MAKLKNLGQSFHDVQTVTYLFSLRKYNMYATRITNSTFFNCMQLLLFFVIVN